MAISIISYVAYWKAISKEAIRRGDPPVGMGTSPPFSHRDDAVRWLDAKINEYHTHPEHVEEGVRCKGEVHEEAVPPRIIRHCEAGILVLSGEMCPRCGTRVGMKQ